MNKQTARNVLVIVGAWALSATVAMPITLACIPLNNRLTFRGTRERALTAGVARASRSGDRGLGRLSCPSAYSTRKNRTRGVGALAAL